jgi:hypothetical protein
MKKKLFLQRESGINLRPKRSVWCLPIGCLSRDPKDIHSLFFPLQLPFCGDGSKTAYEKDMFFPSCALAMAFCAVPSAQDKD